MNNYGSPIHSFRFCLDLENAPRKKQAHRFDPNGLSGEISPQKAGTGLREFC
jgi:hypothetical protein